MTSEKKYEEIEQLEKSKPRSKCRKWMLIVSLGRNPQTGKYDRIRKVFNGTYTEATKARLEMQQEAEQGLFVPSNNITLDSYRRDYRMRREASGRVAPSTVSGDDNRIKAICHLLGAKQLQKITPIMLERAYASLLQGESPNGRKLSGTYVSDCAIALSEMMEDARRHGVIGENPCKVAKRPRRDTVEKKAASPSEIRLLIAMLDNKKAMDIAVLLIAKLGLRRGEAVGLS